MKNETGKELWSIVQITLAAVVYAAGISLFLDPNQLAPGGITGIAVILNRLIHIETGTLYFLLNVPVVFLGIIKFGIRFMAKTAWAILMTSFFTNLLGNVGAVTDDLLMAGTAGGILILLSRFCVRNTDT